MTAEAIKMYESNIPLTFHVPFLPISFQHGFFVASGNHDATWLCKPEGSPRGPRGPGFRGILDWTLGEREAF